jgi:hypothetical protein
MKKDSINTHFIQYRTQIRTIAKSKIKFICMIVIKLQLQFNLKNFNYEYMDFPNYHVDFKIILYIMYFHTRFIQA